MLSKALIKFAIVHSQRIELFRARGGYSFQRALKRGLVSSADTPLAKSEVEYADSAFFPLAFQHTSIDFLSTIRGKRLLDFGSGYGGRTAWYASYASEAYGVEIKQNHISQSEEFVTSKGITNCFFRLSSPDAIPFQSDFFDVVVSADVLEHVEDPRVILKEIHRVLRPGGIALIVFTPYYGAFSHHLNYITMLPALHWVFRPRTVLGAVNELLNSSFSWIGLPQQRPHVSYKGSTVLPLLNGMTKRDYARHIASLRFGVLHMRTTPLLEHFRVAGRAGEIANGLLCRLPILDEAFGHNLVSALRKLP